MKILNWIVKTYKNLKDVIDLVLKIVALVGIITTILASRGCKKERNEKNDTFEILTAQVDTFKTKAGLNAASSKNWELSYKTASKINAKLSSKNSQQVNVIVKAKETISDLNIRLKDTKNIIKTDFIAKDSVKTTIVFENCERIKVEPIRTKHIEIDFYQVNNELKLNYKYFASISTVISREPKKIDNPKRKRYDKNHFPDWGNLPWVGWDYKTTSVIDDENAEITNLVEITFKK